MAINYALLGQYIVDLYATKELDERFQVYGRYIRLLGFDGATYTFAPRIQWEIMPALPAIFLYTDSYPVGFLVQYSQERLDQKDFTVRKILNGETTPMDWREHERTGLVSEAEASVIRLAREKYSIKNAISIPTMLEERGAAGASIISLKEDKDFQAIKQEQLGTLLAITRLFHDTNFSDYDWPRRFIAPVFQTLSQKEIDILHYKASGKAMKNIHDTLQHVKMDYASNVLSALRKRLGGVNSDRLMYLFGLLNALSDIPAKKPPTSM